MREKITYKREQSLSNVNYKIFLEGKRVGTIKQVAGWKYYPYKSNLSGDIFDSLNGCKESIEGD